MALSSYLLLLLVALSVSAVHKGLTKEPDKVLSPDEEDKILGGCLPQGKNPSMEFLRTFRRSGKERHSLYHTYNRHSNNWIVKATVQFDGVEIYCFIQKRIGAWTHSHWGITMKDVDYIFRNNYKDFYPLLKDTDSDLTQRYGCEVERSSSGAVTLLSTTAEFRLGGKIILRFNVDRNQWEALDERLQIKTELNSLTHSNQIIKDYLLQGCTDRLRSYLKLYDEDIRKSTSSEGKWSYLKSYDGDIRKSTSTVFPSDKLLSYTEHPDEDIRKSTSTVFPSDKPLRYTEHPDEDIRNSTSTVFPSDKPLPYTEHPDEDIRKSTSTVFPSDKPLPYTEHPDEDIRNSTSGVVPSDTNEGKKENEEKEGTGIFLVLSCIVIACVAVAMAFALLMKKMINGKPPVKDAYRGYSNGSFSSSMETLLLNMESFSSSNETLPPYMERSTASMDLPPAMKRSTASMDKPPVMKRSTASMDLPPAMKRFTASMDIPPAMKRSTASMDLPPAMKRSTALMHQPPDLAEDDDGGQKLTQVRLAQTAGLTTAGGRLRSTTISLPVFGRWNSRAIWV